MLYLIDGFEWLEQRTYDLRVQYRGGGDVSTSVLLIENDESTMTHLGVPPGQVSRAHYAQAISHLSASGAILIAFDMLFSGQTNSSEDVAMSQALQNAGNVVLARYIGGADHVRSLEAFRLYALGEGLINLSPDTDGVIRSIPFLGVEYVDGQMRPFLTWGAEIARLSIDPGGLFALDVATPHMATYGPLEIPYPQGSMLINYYGPPGTFPSLPLWRVVAGEFEASEVKDKIVLIGGTAATLHDHYLTPFISGFADSLEENSAKREGRLMAGLEVHANVVQTILDESFVRRSSSMQVYIMILLLGIGCWGLIILYPQNGTQVSVLSLSLLVCIVALSIMLFNQHRYWLDVMPLLSLVNLHYGVGMAYQRYLISRQKGQLQSMFSQYLSPDVAEFLWEQREDLLRRISQRSPDLTVTTLAAAFDGFEMTRSVSSDRVFAWMSEYLDEVERLIVLHHGVIEDYTQDGILVHFGILASHGREVNCSEDARNAVACAMDIYASLESLNKKWKDEGLPPICVSAGICTGRAMTTTLGCRGRRKFATVGVSVCRALSLKQMAARLLESGEAPKILCELETAKLVEDAYLTQLLPESVEGTNVSSAQVYRLVRRESMTSM